jgi:carbonic anhydrase
LLTGAFTRIQSGLRWPAPTAGSIRRISSIVNPGEIFVVRNVAALVPPFEETPGHHGVSAALEFAVQFLHVSQIVVLGHGMCGGCKAALTQSMQGAEPGRGGFVADWISLLDDAREHVARPPRDGKP